MEPIDWLSDLFFTLQLLAFQRVLHAREIEQVAKNSMLTN
jgi:hypothetical protein